MEECTFSDISRHITTYPQSLATKICARPRITRRASKFQNVLHRGTQKQLLTPLLTLCLSAHQFGLRNTLRLSWEGSPLNKHDPCSVGQWAVNGDSSLID